MTIESRLYSAIRRSISECMGFSQKSIIIPKKTIITQPDERVMEESRSTDSHGVVLDQPAQRFLHRLERTITRVIIKETLCFGDTAIWAVCNVIPGRL